MSKEKRRVPKLRFPGFTEDWEQRKLSDILVERNEQQVETSEYPLMSFVQGIGVTPKGERYDRSFLVLDQSKKYKRTELGDFIYSSNNLETGSIGINKTGKAVISPVYSIFYGVSTGDSEFIGIMSLLPGFIAKMIRFRQGVVYGQWRIHEKDFLDISVSIPSVGERTKITKLILSIEELITLHQRKLEHLNLKKKALLQKLFPKNGDRYPELRFPGFTDAWEQRKLGDVGMVKSGVGFPEKEQGGIEGIPFYKVSDMNHFDNQFEMIVANNYVSQNQIKKNRWSPITACSAIIFAKVGAAVLLDRKRLCTNSFMLDNNMMAYIVYPEQLNKYFCKFLFDTINLGNLIQVGALPSLNAKDISDIKKYIPNLSEQNRIAKLLLSVETLITLHQRKLDHLQLQKKALLQQMFV